MIILGIDPGTGRLGWGIVDKTKGKETMIDCGCLETPAHTPLAERLDKIYQFVNEIISRHKPEVAAVEALFFATNAKTAISVGAARGVVLLACQQNHLPIFDYTPLQVKSTLTGFGQADKKQVQFMVTKLLHLKETPQPDDAADALAIALTHSTHSKNVTMPS